jgi:O-antigen ligase
MSGCTAMLPRVRIGALVRSVAALGCTLALFGILQKATFNGRIYWVWQPIWDSANAFGPFVNRNHFAGWMVMAAPLVAGYVCGLLASREPSPDGSWRERIAWLSSPAASRLVLSSVALLAMVLSVVWTLSRSGIGAIAVAGIVLGLCAAVRLKGRGRAVGACFVLAALALAVVWRGVDDVAAWYDRTGSLAWRVQLWNDTWPIVRDFRWFGTGFNTYGVSTLVYPMTDTVFHAVEAHNDYLQILSEGGLVLAAAAVMTVLVLARSVRRAFAQEQSVETYWIRIGAVTGLVAIACQEAVEFSLQMPGNAVLFALLVAIALHRPGTRRRGVPAA